MYYPALFIVLLLLPFVVVYIRLKQEIDVIYIDGGAVFSRPPRAAYTIVNNPDQVESS